MQSYARVFTAMAVQDCGGANEVDDLCLGSIEGKVEGGTPEMGLYLMYIHTHIYILL
jgi:hypothetical protein